MDPEALAIRALGFISRDRRALDRVLSRSGRERLDLRRHPIDAELLVASLDFLIRHEPMLLAFSDTISQPPEATYHARRRIGRSMLRRSDRPA